MFAVRETIRTVLRAGAFCALTPSAFADLATELGGPERASQWLLRQATKANQPIAMNFPTTLDPCGPSTTVCISPAGWASDRLRGWIAVRHDQLEAAFGEAVGMRTI